MLKIFQPGLLPQIWTNDQTSECFCPFFFFLILLGLLKTFQHCLVIFLQGDFPWCIIDILFIEEICPPNECHMSIMVLNWLNLTNCSYFIYQKNIFNKILFLIFWIILVLWCWLYICKIFTRWDCKHHSLLFCYFYHQLREKWILPLVLNLKLSFIFL